MARKEAQILSFPESPYWREVHHGEHLLAEAAIVQGTRLGVNQKLNRLYEIKMRNRRLGAQYDLTNVRIERIMDELETIDESLLDLEAARAISIGFGTRGYQMICQRDDRAFDEHNGVLQYGPLTVVASIQSSADSEVLRQLHPTIA